MADLGEGAGCGIAMCTPGHWMMNPDDASCTCEECKTCSATQYEQVGGCIHPVNGATQNGSALDDRECLACTTCEAGRFASTKCSAKADATCSDCQECCPSNTAAGLCKAEKTACNQLADRVCDIPTDWVGKVTTGSGASTCATQCGIDTGEQYTSNATWNFEIKDADGASLFTGQPSVAGPCPAVGCGAEASFTSEPGTSTGKKPTKVIITAAAGAIDSWCMRKLCISSASAGVKFESDMAGSNGLPVSKWMNPGPAGSGPCGGDASSWSLNLVGPTAGAC